LPHLQADVESKTGKAPSPKTEGMEERKRVEMKNGLLSWKNNEVEWSYCKECPVSFDCPACPDFVKRLKEG